MSDYPTGGGYGYNWWDTDQYYTDPADPAGGGGDDTTDAGSDADTVAVDQQIEDLFEDPDFIASLAQLMEEQNFFPDEQSLGEWTNDDWDSYFENFLDPNYNWWDTDFSTYEEDEETYDPYHEDDDVGQAPYGTANDGTPLPDPADYEEGEFIDYGEGGGIYRCDPGLGGKKVWT